MVFILLAGLLCPHDANAIKLKTSKGRLVHESAGLSVVETCLEDVSCLLPAELAAKVLKNYKQLQKAARVVVPANYFSHQVVSREGLRQKINAVVADYATSGSEERLVTGMGRLLFDIVEVSLVVPNDVMKDGLRRNMEIFLYKGASASHAIKYLYDHRTATIDTALDDLYKRSNHNGETVYPKVVTTTARLWTGIWYKCAGVKPYSVYQAFVRRPAQIEGDMKAPLNLYGGIRDGEEAAIVLSSNNDTEMVNGIIRKRVRDNIMENRQKENADKEALLLQDSAGGDELLLHTEKLTEAVAFQRRLFAKENARLNGESK